MPASDSRALIAGALVLSGALHAGVLLLPAPATPTPPRPPDPIAEVELAPEPLAPLAVPTTPSHSPSHSTHSTHAPAAPVAKARAAFDSPAPAAPALAADDDIPHFTIAIGTGDEPAHAAVTSAAPPVATPETVETFEEAQVDQPARLVRGIAPSYPESARAAGVEGGVRLELVVGSDGEVETARVVGGVSPELDRAALAASHQYRFAPAVKAGRAVRVRMRWAIDFRLE